MTNYNLLNFIHAGNFNFQFVMDNVDVYQKPRFMSAEKRPKMYHWVQIYAIKDRIVKGVCMHVWLRYFG